MPVEAMFSVLAREGVEYVGRPGGALTGTLFTPDAEGPFPIVIAVHGGGWRLAPPDNYGYLGPWLAERGIALFAPTYRLAKPGQSSFPEAVRDVRAAVQYVRAHAQRLRIAADRIAILGDSAGGHLASLTALAGDHPLFREGDAGNPFGDVSAAVKAAIPVYGIFDLAQQWRHDQISRFQDHIVELHLGSSLVEDRRIYFDASPMSYVSTRNNGVAFLVCWGTEDDIVCHKTQSEAFVEALKQARFYVRTVVALGAPHFWIADPLDEPGSHSAFFAHRLLRFLQARL